MKNFLNQLTKKQKIMSIIAASLVVILIGLGAYLYKTGRLSFKADTTKYNITISGTATDSITGKPIVGANVQAILRQGQSTSKTTYSATTSSSGTYKMPTTFAVNPNTDKVEVAISGQKIPILSGTANDTQLVLPAVQPTNGIVTQNFKTPTYATVPPITADLSKTLPIPAPKKLVASNVFANQIPLGSTGTATTGPNICSQNYVNGLIYGGMTTVNGVTFCSGYLDMYKTNLANLTGIAYWNGLYGAVQLPAIARLIIDLQKQTGGLVNSIYLLDDQDYKQALSSGGIAETSEQTHTIFIDEKNILKADPQIMLYVMTHEFGHVLDFEVGPVTSAPTGNATYDCLDLSGGLKTSYKCAFSDGKKAFADTWQQLYNSQVLSNYITANTGEYFAEMFAFLMTPTTDFKNFYFQDKLYNILDNYQLMVAAKTASFCEYSDAATCANIYTNVSKINFTNIIYNAPNTLGITSTAVAQNFLAYGFANVMQFAGLVPPDAGLDLSTDFSDAQIAGGNFMTDSAAFVPVTVKDLLGNPIGNIPVNINYVGGGSTRVKQNTGVFADGSGDLFDDTGTGIIHGNAGSGVFSLPNVPGNSCTQPTKTVVLSPGYNPIVSLSIVKPSSFVASLGDSSIFTSGSPKWVAVDKTLGSTKGKIYAVDAGHKGVNVFDSSGTPSSIFTGLTSPSGIVVDNSGNILIADGNQIVMYSSAGTKYPNGNYTGTGTNTLNTPKGLAIDANNVVYVADSGNKRILELTENSTTHTFTYLKTLSTTGADPTVQGSPIVPVTPIAIAVDSKKNIYFTTLTLATGSTTQYNSNLYKIGVTDGKISLSASALNYNSESMKDIVNGVAVDATDNIYYTTQYANPIVKIAPDGTTTSNIDVAKSGANGLAVDSAGNIYAANSGGMRIDKYTPMCK